MGGFLVFIIEMRLYSCESQELLIKGLEEGSPTLKAIAVVVVVKSNFQG